MTSVREAGGGAGIKQPTQRGFSSRNNRLILSQLIKKLPTVGSILRLVSLVKVLGQGASIRLPTSSEPGSLYAATGFMQKLQTSFYRQAPGSLHPGEMMAVLITFFGV